MTENSEHKGLPPPKKKNAQPKIMVKIRLNTFHTQEKHRSLVHFQKDKLNPCNIKCRLKSKKFIP